MGYVKDIPFDKTGILVPGRNQPCQKIMDCPVCHRLTPGSFSLVSSSSTLFVYQTPAERQK